MADVSDKMDDFFAKKDKKKGKSKKTSFLTSEELAKQLEQSAKERELEKKYESRPAKIEEEKEQQIAKQEVSADSETPCRHQSLIVLVSCFRTTTNGTLSKKRNLRICLTLN